MSLWTSINLTGYVKTTFDDCSLHELALIVAIKLTSQSTDFLPQRLYASKCRLDPLLTLVSRVVRKFVAAIEVLLMFANRQVRLMK